eukprot:TRINITY_DN2709_c0_g1_i20.p1 TRINITY_DN2709_c0_g1~~TRINITY_DN2709_c0_g1_i20.p1  ORF type:complete len:115 (-),score=8.17 TRINITY_DN2709_c0_g1_i20:753-1097(-)
MNQIELQPELLTHDRFLFTNEHGSFTLTIQQVIEDDYGLYVWDSAKVLAEWIWTNKSLFKDKVVLEDAGRHCLVWLLQLLEHESSSLTDTIQQGSWIISIVLSIRIIPPTGFQV